jgi:hypothetical protein
MNQKSEVRIKSEIRSQNEEVKIRKTFVFPSLIRVTGAFDPRHGRARKSFQAKSASEAL